MPQAGPIQINLRGLLEQRLGTKMRFVPRFVTRALERLVRQEELNETLRHLYPLRGADFCTEALKYYNIEVKIFHSERLPQDGRCIFVSNHPLGGLDGLALISILKERYGVEPLFVVNDMLMAVEPLSANFIPVNKLGRQSRQYPHALEHALASEAPVVIFPAGLVSRRQPDGSIADLKWQKSFVTRALASHRDIVPMFFDGQNSSRFYNTALWRKRLGIKFNIEMALLPSELIKSRGACYSLTVGNPVCWSELATMVPDAVVRDIRAYVYSLKNETEK